MRLFKPTVVKNEEGGGITKSLKQWREKLIFFKINY